MSLGPVLKDPDAAVDYRIDWSAYLGADSIAASSWSASPAGLTVAAESFTASAATARVAGGSTGTVYSLVNRITTVAGVVDERTIVVRVEQR
jgi:hypothetical protein